MRFDRVQPFTSRKISRGDQGNTTLYYPCPEDQSEQLKSALKDAGLNQTKFFRACVDKFLSEKEEFLGLLGFEKNFFWAKFWFKP